MKHQVWSLKSESHLMLSCHVKVSPTGDQWSGIPGVLLCRDRVHPFSNTSQDFYLPGHWFKQRNVSQCNSIGRRTNAAKKRKV